MLSIFLNSVLIRKYQDFIIMIIHEPSCTEIRYDYGSIPCRANVSVIYRPNQGSPDSEILPIGPVRRWVRWVWYAAEVEKDNWTRIGQLPMRGRSNPRRLLVDESIGNYFKFISFFSSQQKKSKWPSKIKFWHLKRKKLSKLEKQKSNRLEQR